MKPYRVEKVTALLVDEISNIIMKDMKDPKLKGIISISRLELSADMRYAKVYVSVYDGEASNVVEVLNKASHYIRGLLIHRLKLRYVPELRFIEDKGFEEYYRISQLLGSEGAREDRKEGEDKEDLYREIFGGENEGD